MNTFKNIISTDFIDKIKSKNFENFRKINGEISNKRKFRTYS